MMLLGAAFLVFVSLALMGYGLTGWISEREQAKEELARRLAGGGASQPVTVLKDRRLSRIAVLNNLLERMSIMRPLVRLIHQAGLRRRAGEIALYFPLAAMSGVLLTYLATGRVVMALMMGTVAASLPLLVLLRLRDKRAQKFGEQLPDALDLIRAALQAGHALPNAFAVVADEFPDPMAAEMRQVTEEIRLGLPLREALYNLTERVDDPNVPILIVGVLVSQEVGGNLAEVIDSISYTIRERFKLLRDVRVMTAQGRLSGLVLTALPVVVAAALFLASPEYFKPMFQTTAGQYMLAYAMVSTVMGHLTIQRIVRIRV